MIGIYKITSPSNKIYIGQSKDILRRWKEYKYCYVKYKINNSIKKYGIENHKFEIIEKCSINLLNERERYWQDFYNVLDKNIGLNLVLTKTEYKHKVLSEETKIKHIKSGQKIKFNKEWYEKRLNCNKKIVIDVNTGVYYESAKEISLLYNINLSTLRSWLNTTKINKSPFRYALFNNIQNTY
tara:strand:+ start:353 stop:901 length:549 start_codon:yes stop_codon:yes gene_type:complete